MKRLLLRRNKDEKKIMKLFTMICVLICMILPFSVRAEETGQILVNIWRMALLL